jgi:putative oxidoreductase
MGKADWAVVPLRVAVGLVFVMHGGQKVFVLGFEGTAAFMESVGIPLPSVAAGIVMVVELLGGLGLILGAGTRVAAPLLAVDMLVALLTVHARSGFFLPNGIEFVLTLLGASLALTGLGSGPWSVEALLGAREE